MKERLEVGLYRRMLRHFPDKFRREYGEEMLNTFSDTLQDASVEGRLPSFWWQSAVDLVVSLRRERHMARNHAARKGKPAMNRYTPEARLAFHYAREEQHALEHSDSVNTEHILLGIARDHVVATALERCGCSFQAIRSSVQAAQRQTPASWSGGVPQVGTDTRQLMARASAIAKARNDGVIEPRHMLLAILEQPSSLAHTVLTSFATPEQIRAAI